MKSYQCRLLSVVGWLFLLAALALIVSIAQGLWTGRLYNPASSGALPFDRLQQPLFFWLAALARLVLSAFFAGLGRVVLRMREKRCPDLGPEWRGRSR